MDLNIGSSLKPAEPGQAMIPLAQAAIRAGCSPFTVLKWVKRQRLRAYKRPGVRGVWFVPADIDRLTLPTDHRLQQLPVSDR